MVKNIFTWLSSLKGDKNKEWNLFLDILTVTREETVKNPLFRPLKVPEKIATRLLNVMEEINKDVSDEENIPIEVILGAIIDLFLDNYVNDLQQLREKLQKRYAEQGYIPYIQQRNQREKDDLIKQYEKKMQQMENSIQDQINNAVAAKNEELDQVKKGYEDMIKNKDATINSQNLEIKSLKKINDEGIKNLPDPAKKQQ
jgi:hypothetical protein